jgi:phosphatidylglycerol---prolipoprotein diacylglyceryl transferase
MLKMPWLTVCDLGSVGAPIGFGLGRITNFINAELWGRASDAPWAVVFPGAGDFGRHPSQLYEAFLEGAVLLAAMLLLARRMPPRPRGELVGWMVGLYGSFRIFAEFFREPDPQLGFLAAGVTMGQVLSLPMVVLGIWMVIRARRLGLPQVGPGDQPAPDRRPI